MRTGATLVGRDVDLAAFRETWRDVVAGDGPRVVVVQGEAGIGKSRLVEEFVGLLGDEAWVLAGGCAPFVDEAVHFEPFRDALRPLAVDAGSGSVSAGARAVLAVLVGVSTAGSEGRTDSAETGQARLFDAVLDGVVSAAEDRPVLLVLEDIHWAERSSLALIAFLERGFDRHRDARVFMLATCRDGPPAPVAALLLELRRRRARMMQLPPLDDVSVRSVVAELSPRPAAEAWIARVIDRADGNPFMVEELVMAGESDPASAREVLAMRLTGLGPATVRTLQTMAVLGRRVSHELLAAVAAVPEPQLLASIEQGVEAGVLLADTQGGYRFRHVLLQEHLYGQLLPAQHRLLHGRAGDALAAESGGDRDGEVAHHYYQAGAAEQSLRWGVLAAEQAERALALEEARAHYERVLSLWPTLDRPADIAGRSQADVLQRAASLADVLGHRREAAELLAAAVRVLDPGTGAETRAVLLAEQGWAQAAVSPEEAVELFQQAVQLLDPGSSSPQAAHVLALSPSGFLLTGRHAEAAASISGAIATAERSGSKSALGIALARRGVLEMREGQLARAAETYREALRLQWVGSDLRLVADTVSDFTECLHRLGRLEETIDECLSGARRLAERGLGGHYGTGVIIGNAAYSALKLGQIARAEDLYTLAQTYLVADLALVCAPLYVSRGEVARAAEVLNVPGDFEAVPEYARFFLENTAELQLLQGHESQALDTVMQGLAVILGTTEEPCAGRLLLLGLRALANQSVRARNGQRGDLDAVLAAADELAAAGGALSSGPTGSAPAHYVLTTPAVQAQWTAEWARLHGATGEAAWSAAAQAWQHLRRPHPVLYCRLRRCEALAIAGGHRATLSRELQNAYRLALDLQATPLTAEAQELAARVRVRLSDQAGEAAKPRTQQSPYGLTAREREVLHLLEKGMTNTQIARTLFISKGTTSIHVSNIFAKLNVHSRAHAALLARSLPA